MEIENLTTSVHKIHFLACREPVTLVYIQLRIWGIVFSLVLQFSVHLPQYTTYNFLIMTHIKCSGGTEYKHCEMLCQGKRLFQVRRITGVFKNHSSTMNQLESHSVCKKSLIPVLSLQPYNGLSLFSFSPRRTIAVKLDSEVPNFRKFMHFHHILFGYLKGVVKM